jgi:uncharacterized protein
MRPSEALALHKDAILEVLKKYPVKNPRIFGSVARGEDTEDSDLDIVVDKAGRFSYFDMAMLEQEIEAAVGCKVDLGLFKNLKADVLPAVSRDLRQI